MHSAFLKSYLLYIPVLLLLNWGCKSGRENINEWQNFNHDLSNSHFSALDQINTQNVNQLKKVWQYEDSTSLGSDLFFNPVMVRNKLIVLLPSNQLAALDPTVGTLIWKFTPDSTAISNWDRCITYDKRDRVDEDMIYFIFGSTLYCILAKDGSLNPTFGTHGKVDFFEGMQVAPEMRDKAWVTNNAPGVLYKDLFITGCKVPDELPSLPGDIRAFNKYSGKLIWTFHTIPKPGEYGSETWSTTARTRNGGANCWAGMALDIQRGIVYIPTASPSFDFYGADRPGQNLFANCLLVLDATTGKRVWHFQTTHHDLWDRDNGSPPNLITVMKDGKSVDAVGIVTKMGYLYLFNRDNGNPIYPINEVPVDTMSSMPGEKPWPTQPFPVAPPPFARQGFKDEYISRNTPTSYQYIKDEIAKHQYKTGIYEPPSVSGSLLLPAAHGGGNWGGASYNAGTGMLFVNSIDMPWYFALVENKTLANNNNLSGGSLFKIYCASCHGMNLKGTAIAPDISQKVIAYTPQKIEDIMKRGQAPMPSFRHLPQQQISNIIAFLKGTKEQTNFHDNEVKTDSNEPYTFAGYNFYKDSSDLPAVKPPFGTLTAIDINKGEIAWQVPLGENEKLLKLGVKNSGDFNRGGGFATAGGLYFIAATLDKKLRAFDQKDGRVIWENDLPGMGSSIPSTYAVNGKQYVVVALSPNHENHFKGGYIAFGL